MVGLGRVVEVEGEECGAQAGPEQAQEQEQALVAPALVLVDEQQPQLHVHHQEQAAVQSGVEGGEAQLDRRGHGRTQRRRGGVWRRGSGGDRSLHRSGGGVTERPSSTRDFWSLRTEDLVEWGTRPQGGSADDQETNGMLRSPCVVTRRRKKIL